MKSALLTAAFLLLVLVAGVSRAAESSQALPIPPRPALLFYQPIPAVVVQPAAVVVAQPAVPVAVYRRHYWTPIRDVLFGRYRFAQPYIIEAPQ